MNQSQLLAAKYAFLKSRSATYKLNDQAKFNAIHHNFDIVLLSETEINNTVNSQFEPTIINNHILGASTTPIKQTKFSLSTVKSFFTVLILFTPNLFSNSVAVAQNMATEPLQQQEVIQLNNKNEMNSQQWYSHNSFINVNSQNSTITSIKDRIATK